LRKDFEFLSAKKAIHQGKPLFLFNHTIESVRLKILVDLGGILAWLELEELEFG